MNDDTPTPTESRHPIRVVAARSGLTPNLLRAWERRYGVVEPGRSEGGQRLYSDEDIERLALLKQATDAGRSISQVADLPPEALRELVAEDRGARAPADLSDDRVDGALTDAWTSIETMDSDRLEADLRRAVVTLGSEAFTDRLVAPLLRTIGDRWHSGDLRPAHEHLASQVVKRVLHWMVEPARGTGDGPRAVIGTLSGEHHEMGALLAGATAALEGWRVTYVGQNLPAEDFGLAARTVGAQLIGISTVNPLDADGVLDQFRVLLDTLPEGVEVVVGGRVAPDLAVALPDARLTTVESLAAFREVLRNARDAED
ncbi:MerR family transcriptional regulator [Gemmatimonadota bacterium Y43]|uniref:MerR family transcriptional regulator n=1 Tax=Gaopeijia maritima TaxID=3119007 RepID=UPI0032837E1A